jgi:hypothetical protein
MKPRRPTSGSKLRSAAWIAVLLWSVRAAAAAPEAPRPPQGRSYGWQLAIADLAAAGLVVGGIASSSSSFARTALPVAGSAVFLGVGPVIHLAHHNGPGARHSFLMRLLLPLSGAALGAAAGTIPSTHYDTLSGHETCDRQCTLQNYAAVGAGAGAALAMALDWFSARPPPPKVMADAEEAAPAWEPVVAVGPRSAMMGLALVF